MQTRIIIEMEKKLAIQCAHTQKKIQKSENIHEFYWNRPSPKYTAVARAAVERQRRRIRNMRPWNSNASTRRYEWIVELFLIVVSATGCRTYFITIISIMHNHYVLRRCRSHFSVTHTLDLSLSRLCCAQQPVVSNSNRHVGTYSCLNQIEYR